MMPAMRETERTSPFLSAAARIAGRVVGEEKCRVARAVAVRAVLGLVEGRWIMWAVEVGVRCGRVGG